MELGLGWDPCVLAPGEWLFYLSLKAASQSRLDWDPKSAWPWWHLFLQASGLSVFSPRHFLWGCGKSGNAPDHWARHAPYWTILDPHGNSDLG